MTADQAQRWDASSDNPHETLSGFQESLPVRLIATARQNFKTCRPDEVGSNVVERNRDDFFDFMPVLGLDLADNSVVGVLNIMHLTEMNDTAGTVHHHMEPLAERYLIGADASLLAFIRDADRHPFRFIVSGREINGLVSISDLQRLPVRTALFAIVTQLEMTMAEVVRRRFPDPEDWMRLLSQGRAEKVRERVARAKAEDTLVGQILYTEFCDKVTIIDEAWLCSNKGSSEKRSFLEDMEDIQNLRDNFAHANNYADTRDSAKQLCACVRRMEGWIRSLVDWEAELTGTVPRFPFKKD